MRATAGSSLVQNGGKWDIQRTSDALKSIDGTSIQSPKKVNSESSSDSLEMSRRTKLSRDIMSFLLERHLQINSAFSIDSGGPRKPVQAWVRRALGRSTTWRSEKPFPVWRRLRGVYRGQMQRNAEAHSMEDLMVCCAFWIAERFLRFVRFNVYATIIIALYSRIGQA